MTTETWCITFVECLSIWPLMLCVLQGSCDDDERRRRSVLTVEGAGVDGGRRATRCFSPQMSPPAKEHNSLAGPKWRTGPGVAPLTLRARSAWICTHPTLADVVRREPSSQSAWAARTRLRQSSTGTWRNDLRRACGGYLPSPLSLLTLSPTFQLSQLPLYCPRAARLLIFVSPCSAHRRLATDERRCRDASHSLRCAARIVVVALSSYCSSRRRGSGGGKETAAQRWEQAQERLLVAVRHRCKYENFS